MKKKVIIGTLTRQILVPAVFGFKLNPPCKPSIIKPLKRKGWCALSDVENSTVTSGIKRDEFLKILGHEWCITSFPRSIITHITKGSLADLHRAIKNNGTGDIYIPHTRLIKVLEYVCKKK